MCGSVFTARLYLRRQRLERLRHEVQQKAALLVKQREECKRVVAMVAKRRKHLDKGRAALADAALLPDLTPPLKALDKGEKRLRKERQRLVRSLDLLLPLRVDSSNSHM